MADFSKEPYYDDFDSKKNYTKVLAVPGRVEQAREFTQAQTITQDMIAQLGNSLYTNGTVIEGCNLHINEDNQAVISPGKIFLEGLVRNVNETTVKITGVGNEFVGAKIKQEVITEVDDPSLYDPCTNYENYGQAGAHRLRESVVFSRIAEGEIGDYIPIWTLSNGELSSDEVVGNSAENAQERQLQETLARRTYDENGSYKVRGLNLIDRREADDEHIYISVSEGKAYVRGFEVTKSTATRLALDIANTTREIANEAKVYVDRITYKLANQPGSQILRANCKIQYKATMTRGNISGGQDYITNPNEGSVDSIVKVEQGGIIYNEGEDFQLSGSAIDWSLPSKEPQTGSQYTVTYIYNQVMGTDDFSLTHNNYYNLTTTTVLKRDKKANGRESEQDNLDDFIPLKENQELIKVNKVYKRGEDMSPKEETTDYAVTLGKNGTAKIHWVDVNKMEDQSDYVVEMVVYVQEVDPDNFYIEMSESVSQKPVLNSRMVFDYEFYLSRKDLITVDKAGQFTIYKGVPNIARLVESPINQDEDQLIVGTVLIYANSANVVLNTYDSTRLSQNQLFNLRKRVANLEYNMAMSDLDKEAMEGENATQLKGIFTDGFIGLTKADVTHSEFACTFDLDMQEVSLPTQEYIYQASPGTNGTNISKMGSVYMAPFEHALAVSQPYATESVLVNPYAVYGTMAIAEIDPKVDNWVDQQIVNVTAGDDASREPTTLGTLRRWWYHRGESWVEEEKQKWLELTGTTGEQLDWDNFEGEMSQTTSEVVLDELIMYMRKMDINVHGSNFLPYSDNIECYFNDIKVPLTRSGDTESGSTIGTVKSKADGTFDAMFQVPANVQCGTVSVVLKNANNEATTQYTAQGRHQIVVNTVLQQKVIVQATDPLAQSFQFKEDTIITRIQVYFATKDQTKNLIFQVRDMVNGQPGTLCYDEEVINNSSIRTSTDATVPTTIDLSQPVYCKANTQYCFTILTDSNEFQAYTATLGGTDQFAKKSITSNPYTEGVMFDSSNNVTWTEHQTSDLKFDIYKAQYTGRGVIVFDQITTAQISRVVLAAQSIDYKNAGIYWYYRLSASDQWMPIDTYVSNDLSQSTRTMQLRCEMDTKYSTSPMLAGDCINLVCFIEKSEGAYVSRRVVMEQEYDQISCSFEAAIPSGTKVTPKYTLDEVSWLEFDAEPTVTVISDEFNRYEYKKTEIPAGTKEYRVKLEMETENPLVRPRVRRLINILRQVGE